MVTICNDIQTGLFTYSNFLLHNEGKVYQSKSKQAEVKPNLKQYFEALCIRLESVA